MKLNGIARGRRRKHGLAAVDPAGQSSLAFAGCGTGIGAADPPGRKLAAIMMWILAGFPLSSRRRRRVRSRAVRRLAKWLVGAVAGLVLAGPAVATEAVSLNLKWRHQFQFAGYYAAEAQGYYAAEGLEVRIREGRAGRSSIAAVLGGDTEFGVSDSAIVLARLQGKPLVACAAVFQHSPYVIMSCRDRGIRRPVDLVGAKVMLADDQGLVQLRSMLVREGIAPGSVDLVPHSWRLDDLIEGRVDAVSAYATVEPALMRARGVEPAMLRTIDYGVDFYGDALFTTEAEIAAHPKRTDAFVRASLKGWDYALRHPEEVVELILKMDGVAERGLTRESLLAEAAAMRPFILPEVVETGHMNPGRWRRIADAFVEFGLAEAGREGGAALEGFLYEPSHPATTLWSPRLILPVAGVLLLSGLVVLWNMQIRRQVRLRTEELREEVRCRAAVERELRRSEERFRTIFSGATTGIATTTPEGRFLQANPAYCTTTGHSEEELRGIDVMTLIHPEDRAAFRARFDDLLAGRTEHFVIETRCLRKGGGCVWKRASVSALRAGEGRAAGVIAVTEDITERIETAERLRQSEERFRYVARATADAIWDWDVRTGELWWSEGMAKLFGHAAERPSEGLESWTRHIHPEDRERVTAGFHAFITGRKETWHADYRFMRKDGSPAYVLDRAFAIRDAEGRAVRAVGGLTDLTERRLAAERLKASEAQYRLLFHNNPHPMWVYESGTLRFLAVNAAAVAHYGYSEAEFLAMTIRDIRPEGQLEALDQTLAGLVPGEKLFGVWIHRRKDGTEIEVEISSDAIVFDGRSARLTLAHDVTARRRAERERQKTQEAVLAVARGVSAAAGADFFDRLTLSMVEALGADAGLVAMIDPENPGRARTLSLVTGGIVRPNIEYPLAGSPCERIVPGQTRVFARDVRKLFPENRLMAGLEVEAYVGNPLENAAGGRAGVMAVLFGRPLERTEFIASTLRIFAARATAELERRRVDERVREQAALLDKAQDAILVRDLEHRITYWNKSAERLYGWAAEEALGRSVEKLLYQDTTGFHDAMAQLRERGEWVGELQQFNKQGSGLVIEGRWTLVRDDRGVPRAVLAINTDITEKKKLEMQFLRAQRMESIGTLAGGIAHDLNNVLAPIIMAIDLLKLSVTDERGRSMLTTMAASARRGAEMVRQVLSFARGVEGRRVEVHPSHLIREIEKIALDTFPKNIQIETRAETGLWTITGDPTQLHQVLINLCVNARDAMPGGGRLVVGAQNQVLDARYAAANIDAKPGPYVALQIEDTGTGIPAPILDKIFDPFFTTKALGKGTGLGLSTSLAIVKSHDGFIRVYSEPGRGSRFQIYLPARPDGAGGATAVVQAELPRGCGETVLVVDDEDSIRQIARRTLEAFGYQVLLASDGAEALEVYSARRDEIAVVLTDMMMPVMDGAATIHALLKINPRARILAASGIAANGDVAKTAGVGARHFISKPYTADTLLKALRQILDEELKA